MNSQRSSLKKSSEPGSTGDTLLEMKGVSKHFPVKTGFFADIFGTNYVYAVDDVSLDLTQGETLAIVGEPVRKTSPNSVEL